MDRLASEALNNTKATRALVESTDPAPVSTIRQLAASGEMEAIRDGAQLKGRARAKGLWKKLRQFLVLVVEKGLQDKLKLRGEYSFFFEPHALPESKQYFLDVKTCDVGGLLKRLSYDPMMCYSLDSVSGYEPRRIRQDCIGPA